MTSFCKSFTPTNSLIKSGMVLNLKCFIQNSCHTSGTDHNPLRTRLLWEIFIIYYLYLCLFRWVRNRWDVPFLVDNAPTRKAECIETILGRNIFFNFLGWVVPKSLKTYLPKLGNWCFESKWLEGPSSNIVVLCCFLRQKFSRAGLLGMDYWHRVS